jgi:peptidoglycan/xylan/chitin deacetylase (PgdA/CDA1 family)
VSTAALVAGAPLALPAHGLRKLAERRLEARCRERRALVLTYDDGPGPVLTPALLEILAERRARATFFALGRRAQQAPEVLDRVAAAGHEVGCHSFDHRHAWKVSPRAGVADLDEGYRSLARWVRPDGLFRPPYGKLTLATWAALRRRRGRLACWTVVSGDTYAELPRQHDVVEHVVRSGGGVVLMHDFDREPERGEYVTTLTARLLDAAERHGLSPAALGDVLGSA